MESSKLAFKLFLQDAAALPRGAVVPVFHGFIQQRAVPDHLLIDVADYEHVPEGPGSLLVSHEANIHIDEGEGRRGLLYFRKQSLPGDLAERIRQTLRYTLELAALLEKQSVNATPIKFRTDELVFRVHDRLHAPNTAETYEAVKPALEQVLAEAYAIAELQFSHAGSPRELFEVRVKSNTNPGVSAMLECLGFFPAVG